MFVRMIFSESQNILLPNLVWWYSIMSQSAMRKKERTKNYFVQGQGHSEGLYHQNATLSNISSELLISRPPNLAWWYIIISQSVLWTNWITVFKIKVTAKGQNVMFVLIIFSKPPNILFPNLVLWCTIMSRSSIQKDWCAIFKVKVTASGHMIQIWQFLLYLLNCWSFCYENWFVSTLS